MFEAVKLPARVSHLDPCLSYMDAYDLPHLTLTPETLIMQSSASGDEGGEIFFLITFGLSDYLSKGISIIGWGPLNLWQPALGTCD